MATNKEKRAAENPQPKKAPKEKKGKKGDGDVSTLGTGLPHPPGTPIKP